MRKPWHKLTYGGNRQEAGRPWSPEDRCPCGRYTLSSAAKRGHHCDANGTIPGRPGRPRTNHTYIPLSDQQRLARILRTVRPDHFKRMLDGMELMLDIPPDMPPPED